MSRRNRPGRARAQPRDLEVAAVTQDGEGRAGPMAVEVVAVADLHIDPANVRRHPERNLATIKASLARFGQQKPVVIDANNVVRAGNGTLMAAMDLGWDSLRCVRTGLGGTDAVAYSIADNQSALQAEWDYDALGATLRALQDEDFDLDAVGFTDAEVDALLGNEGGEVVEDPQAEWQGMPEFEHEDQTAFRTLHIHFRSAEDVQHFGTLIGQDVGENAKYLWYPEQQPVLFEKMRYVDQSEIPDLHHLQGPLGGTTAAHEPGP
jgi:hypothetical protein